MEPRTFLSSRFRILRCIGSGSTGDVYEAIDREHGARVALKALRHLLPHAITRFKHEFRALQDVQHANLVSFGELLEEDGRLFFTMELIKGVDFISHVRPEQLDEARLRRTLGELGRGLDALHERGKIHRDIKPSNVLVTDEGRVVILDFGLLIDAEHGDSWSGPSIVGTPHYMAPEQAAGTPAGPPADWYGVGVMLYEALTGHLPHEGPLMKILLEKQTVEPAPPESLDPTVPADLAALCMQLLRFEPAERPAGPAVLRKLGRAPTAPARRPAASTVSEGPPFVGREDELEVLGRELARTVAEARPAAVVVHGESGVGKTTLVRVFARALDARAVVIVGRCFERESVSYKAFDGISEALARLVARMEPTAAAALLPLHAAPLAQVFPALKRIKAFADAPPSAGELDHRDQRARVFGAMRELLAKLAQRHQVVLAIDDLQWADDDSLDLLTEVLRPPEAPPLLVIATLRPVGRDDAPGAEARLRAACPTRSIALRPLDAEESRQLATMLLHVHDVQAPVDVDALSREAAGHPLFLDELVRHAAAFGDRGSIRLEDALHKRVAALEPRARAVLEVVALAGEPTHQDTIARAADVAPEQIGRVLSALRVANLVRTAGARAGDTVEPFHDRVRQAIAGGLSPERRRELHHALAVTIEGARHPGQESMLAFHWQGAGRDDLAAVHAAAAAERAAAELAFDRATRLYRTALDLGHPDRGELLARLGDAFGLDGRGAEAAEAFLAAAEETPAAEVALDLRRLAAEQLLISGRIERGLALITTLLDTLGMALPRTPRRSLMSLVARRALLGLRGLGFRERQEGEVAASQLTRVDLCWSVATGLAMVDTVRGADFQTRHLLLALRAGEPTRVARALATEGGFQSTSGPAGRRRGKKLFEAARKLLDRTPSPHGIALLLGAECIAAYQGGQWRRALELAREGELAVRRQQRTATWELDTIHFFWLYSLFYLGELHELSVLAPALLRDATARGDLFGATNLRAGLCNAAWLVGDDPDQARAHLEEAARQWTPHGFHVQHYHHLLGRSNLALYVGDAAAGLDHLIDRWPALAGSQLLRVDLVRIEALHVRARLALAAAEERPAEQDRYLDEAARCAKQVLHCGEPWAVPLGHLVRAAVRAARDERDGAAADLRAAADGLDAADMALWATVARGRLGALTGDAGLAEVSRAALRAQGVIRPDRLEAVLAPGFG